jgi:integrase
MPSRTLRQPSYRHHKPSGQAVVTLDGKDRYLGRYGTPESEAEYDRLISEWLAHGRRLPAPGTAGSDLSVNEMLLAYLHHAEGYYLKDGQPTSETANIKLAIRPLRRLYGHTAAKDFGPKSLKAVRQALIDSGLCRGEVNKRVGKIVRAFKWAVGEELIPPSVHHGLRAVSGLRAGRADVRESQPIKPVPDAFVDAIKPYVSRQVWAMVELQRLTAMRPGEAIAMRMCDLDTSGKLWCYTPRERKTAHYGKERPIYLGPRAVEVVRPWLRTNIEEPLFQPREAKAERLAELRTRRKTPVQPSQQNRRRRRPRKVPGMVYTVASYRRAIKYACQWAGVPKWHPNQLRHTAATRLRKEFGIDTARAVLGHSSPAVTEVYAELDREKAVEAMDKIG